MKELLSQGIVKVKDIDEKIIKELMNVIDIAEELAVDVSDQKVNIAVQKCLICPKRVGNYDLEGNTACPVAGLITGAVSYARGSNPMIVRNTLSPGEICFTDVELSN